MWGNLRLGYLVLFGLCAAVMAAAILATDYPLSTYFGLSRQAKTIALWFLPSLLWLCWICSLVIVRRFDKPSKAIMRMAVRNRHWLARGFLFGLLLLPLSMAFLAMKRSIPELVPYYADPMLAYADRLLFLGTDPWRVTHALFGPVGTAFIDRVYVMWFPSCALLMGWFMFTRDQRFQIRGLITYVVTWFLLGSLAATLLSSVGPVYYGAFYGSGEFAPLVASIMADDAQIGLWAPTIQEGLLRSHNAGFIGAAISAMPSLHVAMAVLLYLVTIDRTQRRGLHWLAFAYVVLIFVGSIHLGWHYAVDGLFSIVATVAIWRVTGKMIERLSSPAVSFSGKPLSAQ